MIHEHDKRNALRRTAKMLTHVDPGDLIAGVGAKRHSDNAGFIYLGSSRDGLLFWGPAGIVAHKYWPQGWRVMSKVNDVG